MYRLNSSSLIITLVHCHVTLTCSVWTVSVLTGIICIMKGAHLTWYKGLLWCIIGGTVVGGVSAVMMLVNASQMQYREKGNAQCVNYNIYICDVK